MYVCFKLSYRKFRFPPIGALAPRSAHTRPSTRPPFGMSTHFILTKFLLAPLGVLASGSAHARPSGQPPIDTSGNFSAHISAKSPSNISPFSAQKLHSAGGRGVSEYFCYWNPTRGIVVEYQYQGAGIGIVLFVVKNLLYPIPNQYKYSLHAKLQSETKK